MRVLQLIHSLDSATGGPARSVPGLAAALVREGVDITTASVVPPSQDLLTPPPNYVRLRRSMLFWQLPRLIATHDLVHAHGIWDPVIELGCRSARWLGRPYILALRGMVDQWSLSQKRLKKSLAWSLYQKSSIDRAALIHVTTQMELEHARVAGLRTPAAVIPNGVNAPTNKTDTENRGDRLHRRMTFVSRIHPKKGVDFLIQAWTQSPPEGWRLTIAGPGSREQIKWLASAIAECPSIEYLGELGDRAKWELLRASDLFILPTHTENYGIAIAEALAAGVPVITTQGAPWPQIEQLGLGWRVPVQLAAISRAISAATRCDQETLQSMGKRARNFAASELSWERIARQTAGEYIRLLERDTNDI